MRESIVTAVQTVLLQRNELRILVTGHSMGGAMASFCALDLTVHISLSSSLSVK
jgi:putative lipase involved disintegration of autophagic bodies